MTKHITRQLTISLFILLFPLAIFCQAPSPQWVKDIGGPGDSKPSGMVVDAQNNIYITGYFTGTVDFDPSAGVKNLTSNGGDDIYVAKYKPDGTLIWAESMGGNALDQANCMNIDKDGNITIIGQYQSSNFDADPGPGVFNLQNNGTDDIFIIHLDTNGAFLWAKTIGGDSTDRGEEVSTDKQDNVITTSIFQTSINVSGNTINAAGSIDGLIIKYDPSGNLLWTINLGQTNTTQVFGNRTDSNGNITVSGTYNGSVDFNPLGAAHILNSASSNDIFVAKYTSTGQLMWVNTITGTLVNDQSVISIDSQDNVYFTGAFFSPLTFNGNVTINPVGIQDMFIAKYLSTGGFQFVKSIGGSGGAGYVYQLENDQNNNVYLTGYLKGTMDFNPDPSISTNISSHGQQDFFLAQYDQNGNYVYAFGGGSAVCSQTVGNELAIDNTNTPVLAGAFCSTVNFDPTNCSTLNVTAINGLTDTYIAKYSNSTFSIIGNNVISAPFITSFCTSGTPGAIVGAVPTGGPGTYSYQWQSSADSITFVDISGAVSKDYSPPSLNITRYYRRKVSVTCTTPPTNSNIIGIKIQQSLSNNTITAPAIISFCAVGDAAVIVGSTPSGGNGSFNYQWQSSLDNVTFTDITGATSKDYDPPSITVTTYYRRTITSGACTVPLNSGSVLITIFPLVSNNVITAPSATSFCVSGDPGIITGNTPTGGNGAYTYQWQSSADNINFADLSGATAISYDPPVLSATTYFRRLVVSGLCNTPLISNVTTITIISSPPTPIPVNPTVQICTGNGATLAVSSPQQGLIYNWYDSAAKTNLVFTGTVFLTPALSAGITYYIEATNGSCPSPILANVQVIVNSAAASPTVLNNAVGVCSGTSASIGISNPQSGFTYNWYSTSANGTSLFTGTNFTTPALSSSTTYYAEAVNASGCPSSTRTPVNVTVNSLPQITGQGTSVCPGSSATITASSTDQNATINWYPNSAGGNILFTGLTFTTPVINSNTTYYAEAVDNNTGCISTNRSPVQVILLQPLAAPVVTIGSTTNSSVTFQWTAVSGAAGYEVSIDNGQTFATPSSGVNGLTHTVSGLQPTQTVSIVVRAVGASPCQLSLNSIAVTSTAIDPLDNQIFVANAFTPNGDGKNDVVYVHSLNIKSLKFYIYDQWGELIYTSTSQQSGWDGTYKGSKEPVGVYVYYLEAIMNNGKQINKKGTITLLK